MPEQKERSGAPDWKSLVTAFWRKWRATSIRIVPLARWLLAAEKLPAHQNEDDAASAAEFSF